MILSADTASRASCASTASSASPRRKKGKTTIRGAVEEPATDLVDRHFDADGPAVVTRLSTTSRRSTMSVSRRSPKARNRPPNRGDFIGRARPRTNASRAA